MSETGNAPPVPRTARWVKIALALSLALNLAIVGMVAGVVLRAGDRGDGAPELRTLGLGPFALALTRDDRDELRGRIERHGEPLRQERRAIGQALRAVQAALLAEPFDRAAAEAAFAQSRDLAGSLQATGHGALLDQIETMSAGERTELAERLARMMRRFGPDRH